MLENPIIRTSGNRRPWEVATKYKRQSDQSARLESAPPMFTARGYLADFLTLATLAVTVALLIVAFTGD